MRTLTDYFTVYLINCTHRKDRLRQVTQHMVAAEVVDMSKVIVYPGIRGELTTNPEGWMAGRGAWGCMRSHIRILEDELQKNEGDVMILEDDVFFVPGALGKINNFMDGVPGDWGQLYFGGQHVRPPDSSQVPGIVLGKDVNRTHAYCVSRGRLAEVYRFVAEMNAYVRGPLHIDQRLQEAHRRRLWPVYCPRHWIVGQESGFSDITLRHNDRLM